MISHTIWERTVRLHSNELIKKTHKKKTEKNADVESCFYHEGLYNQVKIPEKNMCNWNSISSIGLTTGATLAEISQWPMYNGLIVVLLHIMKTVKRQNMAKWHTFSDVWKSNTTWPNFNDY